MTSPFHHHLLTYQSRDLEVSWALWSWTSDLQSHTGCSNEENNIFFAFPFLPSSPPPQPQKCFLFSSFHKVYSTILVILFIFTCCSVTKLCPILHNCNPMDYNIPNSPIFYLPEFAQIHAHCINETI